MAASNYRYLRFVESVRCFLLYRIIISRLFAESNMGAYSKQKPYFCRVRFSIKTLLLLCVTKQYLYLRRP
jgi:hypothetical protein